MNLDHLIYAPSFIKGNNDIGTVELQTLAALDTWHAPVRIASVSNAAISSFKLHLLIMHQPTILRKKFDNITEKTVGVALGL